MNNLKCAKILAIGVSVTGVIVMIGWFFDIMILKSILPNWVTMKFTTALSFFLSGITLYFLLEIIEEKITVAQTIIPIAVFTILIIMATLFISTFLNVRTGIEDLFVQEAENAVKTLIAGRPSIGTMICFIIVAVAGIWAMFLLDQCKSKLPLFGWPVMLLGSVAIIGYCLNIPLFYYEVESRSTAMAFHTALLFIMLGSGLVLAGTSKQN